MSNGIDMISILPTVSRAGDFFRTLAFAQPKLGEGYTTRYEAVEHPLTNRWQVQAVTERPNVLTSVPPTIEEYDPVKGMGNLSLVEAIQQLAAFEHSQLKAGHTATGAEKEELGESHVEVFAALNGFVLDIENNAHLMMNGRIVGQGQFVAGARDKAAALYQKGPSAQGEDTQTRIAHMFNAHVRTEDFTRILDQKDDLAKWKEFVKSARHAVKHMIDIQDDSYDTEVSNGMIFTTVSVDGEKEFYSQIEDAKAKLRDISYVPLADKNGKFSDFFEQVKLAYLAGYAKYLFRRYNQADEGRDEKRSECVKALQVCEKKCRALGGTDRDVQAMRADISTAANKRRLSDYFDDRKYSDFLHATGADRDDFVYYLPESLVEFLMDMEETTRNLVQGLKQEEKRIKAEPKGESIRAVSSESEGKSNKGFGFKIRI